MTKVKNQHYVPRFYLRNFSIDDKIYVFDKKNMKSFSPNITGIASETYFYDTNPHDIELVKQEFEADPTNFLEKIRTLILETKHKPTIDKFMQMLQEPDAHSKFLEIIMDSQYIETKVLAPSEGNWASLVKNVIGEIKWRKRIKKSQRKDLVFMMVVQLLRTPKFRNEVMNLEKRLVTHVFEEYIKETGEDLKLVFTGSFPDRISRQYLTDASFISGMIEVLSQHIWAIGINSTSKALYTSDAPIVRTGHIKNPLLGVGFASTGVEIAYPLSTNYVLLLYEREYFQNYVKEGQVLLLNEENIEFYNSMQVQQSRRQVYCRENDFYLAIDMCIKNPKLRDPDRSHINIK